MAYSFRIAVLLFLAVATTLQSQTGFFSARPKKKAGNYTFYFDKDFNVCIATKARYKGAFYLADNGTPKNKSAGRLSKRQHIVYKPLSDTSGLEKPLLLNGNLEYYSRGKSAKLLYTETYSEGQLTVYKEFSPSKKFSNPETITVYYDSLYNNNQNTLLFYRNDNNANLYKQYMKYNKPLATFYFVPYKLKQFEYRPIAGYHSSTATGLDAGISPRGFVELGLSRKYLRSVYMDTTKRHYNKNNFEYFAINAALLGGNSNGTVALGQKISASYTLLIFRAEAGIVNYHTFKQSDLRLLAGGGISVYHWANLMIYYSLPVVKNPFPDISRVSISIFIN